MVSVDDRFALDLLTAQKLQMIAELRDCNDLTVRYGLYFSEEQMQNLAKRRFKSLRDTGRIEFGQGILKKLVTEFCDSPYITQENYEDTILELQDSFYYFKNESMDRISDEELIAFMKRHFDGICQGSLDYLNGTSLEDLCRNTRYGYRTDNADELF
jgi:hypothetical protein